MDTPIELTPAQVVAKYRGDRAYRAYAEWWNEGLPEERHITSMTLYNWEHDVYSPTLERLLIAQRYYPEDTEQGKMVNELLSATMPPELAEGE